MALGKSFSSKSKVEMKEAKPQNKAKSIAFAVKKKMSKGGMVEGDEPELPEHEPRAQAIAAGIRAKGRVSDVAMDTMDHDDYYSGDFLSDDMDDEGQVDALPDPQLDVADDDGVMSAADKLKDRMKKVMSSLK